MTVFYFTGTGNSLYVAKRLGGTRLSIPRVLQEKKTYFEDDAIGVVFPCYGFGAPKIVDRFMKTVTLNARYYFAVMTYGNIPGGTLWNFSRTAKKRGVSFHYADRVLMVDNYSPVYNIETQIARIPEKRIEETLSRVIENVRRRATGAPKETLFEKAVSRFFHPIANLGMTGACDIIFRVTDACDGCGICKRICPGGNILMRARPRYLHRCEGCFGCIMACPKNAIRAAFERNDCRFINDNVTVKELIEANEQAP